MPPVAVHFNGGVNLPDTTAVLRTLAERVPRGFRRLPDGETGERAQWIGYQRPRLEATPGLELTAGEPGAEGPYGGGPVLRVSEATDPDRIAWPEIGYASEYRASYATFRELRGEDVVPVDVRFQVEYPTPQAVSHLFHPADRARITPSYERALLADLGELLAAVPHRDLAVQWDAAVETVTAALAPESLGEQAGQLAGLVDHVPGEVHAGVHLCYGDAGHEHMVEPESLATQVRLANAVVRRARRPLDWLSFTVPQYRADAAYFAPLADLRTGPGTELFFALVPYHPDEQAAGTTEAQVALVDRYLPGGSGPWGICTECGMARADRADVPRLLDLHREILAEHSA
ncbi:hypothetical protein [Saccharopolyspora erythraea]|uniref:hypothetical protein n=1 Tax=Saccharopolyspora erythraea TaxID=1836 RepID=UPI002013B20B|nr:hypothetical protein [Saccharopolyspora erythraea]